MLPLMWQSLPAEGRQNAHDSFFQEPWQNNRNDAPGGYECEKARWGGSHAGHLVCGLPTEGTATNKTCWSQFLALCTLRSLGRGLRGGGGGGEGQNSCTATPSPRAAALLLMDTSPGFSQEEPGFIRQGEKQRKRSQIIPSPRRTRPKPSRERRQAPRRCGRLLSPSSCLLHTRFPYSDAALRGQLLGRLSP